MATSKSTLINWFKRGLKPLATQFEAWINSYWHKDEAIPMASVENLVDTINAISPATIAALRDGVPTQGNTLNKLYNLITSVGEFVGDHDASTGLPTTGSGEAGAIDKGDYWLITTPGTIVGLGDLAVGDVLFAKVAGADEASEFFYLPFASLVGDASTTEKGIVELADESEARAGIDTQRVVTPWLLALNTRPADEAGTEISFDNPNTRGRTSPVTGNITVDYTNAVIGNISKIYHDDSSAPTFPSDWKNIGINEYVPGELNIIIAEYVRASDDRVEYFILQPNATKEAVVLKKSGKLTVAQIETLGAGIDIVPAPGAGKAIQFHNAFLKYTYQTTPYGSTHDELRFEIGLSVVSLNFLLLSLTITSWAHIPLVMNAGMTTYENLPLKLKCPTGNPSGGNSELHYTVFYSIVDTEHT